MERILTPVGVWHLPVFVLSLFGSVTFGLFVMSLSFMAPKMNYWCRAPPNVNNTLWFQMNEHVDIRCEFWKGNATRKCLEWEYDHSFHKHTLVEQWDAVCDRHWMRATAQSFLMFGILVGCFVFSHISDWYGRKKSYILSLVFIIISGFAISFTTSFWAFCVLRFLAATGHGGRKAGIAFYTESVGANHRATVTVGQDIGWCLGILLISLITYHVRDWVLIQRIIILPEFLFLAVACYADETPKWLLATGNYGKTEALLQKIIRQNKLDGYEVTDVHQIVEDAKEAMLLEKRSQKGTVVDLLRGWTISKRTISCWGQYAVIILLYYHMLYFIVDIGSDPYMGVVYMGLLELPITTSSIWIVNRFRRKPVYFSSWVLAILSGLALMFPSKDSVTIRMVLANVGKMASMFLYNNLLVHISECFPTKVRSVALGSSAMASRVGAMVAPFLKEIGLVTAPWVPLCITVTMCTLGMLLSFLLPETFGQNLPDTFHEAKQMMRQTSSLPQQKSLLTSS